MPFFELNNDALVLWYKSTPLSTKQSANLSSVATLNILFICNLYIPVRFSEQTADEQKVIKLLKMNFENFKILSLQILFYVSKD